MTPDLVSGDGIKTNRLPFALHIGLPETCPAVLRRLFTQHPEIGYLKGFSELQATRTWTRGGGGPMTGVLRELLDHEASGHDATHGRQALAQASREAAAGTKIIIGSRPALGVYRPDQTARVCANAGRAFGTAKVLVVIRHPFTLVETMYWHARRQQTFGSQFRTGQITSIEQWLQADGGSSRGGRALPNRIQIHLDYVSVIREWVSAFSRETVGVFLFESWKEDPEAFARGVCRFLDADPEEGARLIRREEDPKPWTTAQWEKAASVRQSPLRQLRFRFVSKIRQRAMLGLSPWDPAHTAPIAQAKLPQGFRDAIEETSAEGNHWLDSTFGLDLARYGYPL